MPRGSDAIAIGTGKEFNIAYDRQEWCRQKAEDEIRKGPIFGG